MKISYFRGYLTKSLAYDGVHDEAVTADHRVSEDDRLAYPRPGTDDDVLADAHVGAQLEFRSGSFCMQCLFDS